MDVFQKCGAGVDKAANVACPAVFPIFRESVVSLADILKGLRSLWSGQGGRELGHWVRAVKPIGVESAVVAWSAVHDRHAKALALSEVVKMGNQRWIFLEEKTFVIHDNIGKLLGWQSP